MSFEERSNALVKLLEKLEESDHEYVLIGGYAVSAFNPRFSTDLDVVISPRDENEFRDFLDDEGFELKKNHRKDWFYDREVKEYKKYLEPGQPIGFDLLVNGLGCRQTEAEWSFRHLRKYSTKKEVMAGTLKTIARVVDPEVLIAAKLHSGRETDLRDVTALVDNVELEDVTQHLRRGGEDALREQLENGLEILEGEDLKQGYKSDFGESAVPEESVEKLRRYLREQIETLS